MYTSWKIFWGGLLGAVVGMAVWAGWIVFYSLTLDPPDYNSTFDAWFPFGVILGSIHGLICAAIIGNWRLKIFKGVLVGILPLLFFLLLYASIPCILTDPDEPHGDRLTLFIVILLYSLPNFFLLFVPSVVTGGLIGALSGIPERVYLSWDQRRSVRTARVHR